MKFLYAIIILTLTVAGREAIVCLPESCANITCEAITEENCESDGKIYVPNGGFCGCCSICKTVIAEGQPCPISLRGVPSTWVCESGTSCQTSPDGTRTCQCNSNSYE